jgi:hypothetical protein
MALGQLDIGGTLTRYSVVYIGSHAYQAPWFLLSDLRRTSPEVLS